MKKTRIYSYLFLLFLASLVSCREDDIEEGLGNKKLSAKDSKIVSQNVVPNPLEKSIQKIDSLHLEHQVNDELIDDQEPKGIPPKK